MHKHNRTLMRFFFEKVKYATVIVKIKESLFSFLKP